MKNSPFVKTIYVRSPSPREVSPSSIDDLLGRSGGKKQRPESAKVTELERLPLTSDIDPDKLAAGIESACNELLLEGYDIHSITPITSTGLKVRNSLDNPGSHTCGVIVTAIKSRLEANSK